MARKAGSVRLTDNALTILQARYLAPGESPEDLFRRVARHVAQAEEAGERGMWEERFYGLMASLRFLPNSPMLFNAGRHEQGSLSACFVIPVEDSMDGIMRAAWAQAMTLKWGGGTGFSLSRLRPRGDAISTIHGRACGPVAVLRLLNQVSRTVTQSGMREGANMAVLDASHPDILEFVRCKNDDPASLSHFNISVAASDAFMQAVTADGEWELRNPRDGAVAGKVRARELFREICEGAWRTGDPGLLFVDRANRDNPLRGEGLIIETTNPCGEQPLLAWENCTLGHMNLLAYLREGGFDFEAFAEDVALAIRFLDDVVTVNSFPVPEQREWNLKTRRIGLGVMGLHDVLIGLGIPYDSEEALRLAGRIASVWREASDRASLALGEERGPYGLWRASSDHPDRPYRNAWRRTVAPTGTVAIIAGCSSGIEPWFSFAHERRTADGRVLLEAHEGLRRELLAAGLREGQVEEVFGELLRGRRLGELRGIPERVKAVYRSALEIGWTWHVSMQAVWQEHCDSGISKTINLPNDARVEDIQQAYLMAWQMGCKGITVFRDGCREGQVLSHRGKEQAKGGSSRRRLPDERPSLTHKFQIGELEGYITAGLYEDGSLGEVFIRASKEGSLVSGLLDALGISLSIALQHGVPIEAVTKKLKGISFEPAGLTGNRSIPTASSVVDYIARWIESKFGNGRTSEENGGRACPDCGGLLRQQEGCYICAGCGYSKCG